MGYWALVRSVLSGPGKIYLLQKIVSSSDEKPKGFLKISDFSSFLLQIRVKKVFKRLKRGKTGCFFGFWPSEAAVAVAGTDGHNGGDCPHGLTKEALREKNKRAKFFFFRNK
ncbi:hypothetical protein ES332_D03G173100v1 [Gossypium tomentosum]|uniref:Uncharacterized protein n=1 Tax=Gossypium tomentosum TaxID=34277 RepID=A0A5D2LNX0_GOSTO|nr:hypothetical protein ES332_D03G173100v1 [Gossypium tomentosum]